MGSKLLEIDGSVWATWSEQRGDGTVGRGFVHGRDAESQGRRLGYELLVTRREELEMRWNFSRGLSDWDHNVAGFAR